MSSYALQRPGTNRRVALAFAASLRTGYGFFLFHVPRAFFFPVLFAFLFLFFFFYDVRENFGSTTVQLNAIFLTRLWISVLCQVYLPKCERVRRRRRRWRRDPLHQLWKIELIFLFFFERETKTKRFSMSDDVPMTSDDAPTSENDVNRVLLLQSLQAHLNRLYNPIFAVPKPPAKRPAKKRKPGE